MLNLVELRSLPKIELHLHLDCSLSYDVVSVLDPSVTREEYEHEFIAPARCSNLADFLLRAPKGFKLMQPEDALRRVTEDLFHQLHSDGVVYAEIRFAPFLHVEQGLEPDEVVEVVESSVEAMMTATGIQAGVILCTLRHFNEAQSMATAKLVEQFRGSRVIALDLAGDEAGYQYRPTCRHIATRASAAFQGQRMLARLPARRAYGKRFGCSIRSAYATAPAASRTRCLSNTCDATGFTWNSVPVLTCRSYRRSEAWIIIRLIDSIGPEFS